MPRIPNPGRGEVYAALAAMAYGSSYVAAAFALRSFHPLALAVDRAALAAIPLAALMVLQRRGSSNAAKDPPPAMGARPLRLGVLGACGGLVFLVGQNLAVQASGATVAAFVAGLYAVLAAVAAPFFLPERLTVRVLGALALALLGTALLAELDPAHTNLAGIGWGLMAATSFALYLVLGRRWASPYRLSGVAIAFATVAIAGIGIGAAVAISDPASFVPAGIRIDALLALMWLAFTIAAGQILVMASVRRIPASRSAAFLLLNPVTALLLAIVLLGERPSPLQLLGGLLVLAGIAAATLRGRPGPSRQSVGQ